MLHGVDGGEEDVVHPLLRQPGHVAVDQLHWVAGLRLGGLLGEADDLLIGGRGEEHVVPQLPEEGVGHGEELVDHQGEGHPHRLAPGDRRGIVSLQKQLRPPLVKGDVTLHLRRKGGGFLRLAGEAVETGGALRRIQGQQGGAEGPADGEAGGDGEPVPEFLTKGGHDPGVVGHAALEDDLPPHRLAAHHLVQVVSDNRLTQAGGHLCLGGTLGQGGLDGCLDEYGAPLAQLHRRLGGEGQGTEFLQRDAHAGGLFLHKGAGAGGADLIHLEIRHLTAPQ